MKTRRFPKQKTSWKEDLSDFFTGKPVTVRVEEVELPQSAYLSHKFENLSDFDPLDFYLPLSLLFLIFALQMVMGFTIVGLVLQFILFQDLYKRVGRRPSGRLVTAMQPPAQGHDWGQAFRIYFACLPLIIASIWVNGKLMNWFFPQPEVVNPFAENPGMESTGEQPFFEPDNFDFDPQNFEFDPQNFEKMFFEGGGSIFYTLLAIGLFALLIEFFMTVVMAPITEELWFRGIGLASLMKNGSLLRSVVITSVIFGALHGPGRVIFATVFGLVMALIRFRTSSLYCCMAVHAFHNFGAVVIGIYLIVRQFQTLGAG